MEELPWWARVGLLEELPCWALVVLIQAAWSPVPAEAAQLSVAVGMHVVADPVQALVIALAHAAEWRPCVASLKVVCQACNGSRCPEAPTDP